MPNILEYDHGKMRKHLNLMFKNNRLNSFPSKETSDFRSTFVEHDWKKLSINRSENLFVKKLYSSKLVPVNEVSRILSLENSVINLSSPQKCKKKKLRLIKDRERKQKERIEETSEQKRKRQEKRRINKENVAVRIMMPRRKSVKIIQ